MFWIIRLVWIVVSVALLIWPTKDDPDTPGEKQRDWPAIIGCFLGGVAVFKLWLFLVSQFIQYAPNPLGAAGRVAAVHRRMPRRFTRWGR